METETIGLTVVNGSTLSEDEWNSIFEEADWENSYSCGECDTPLYECVHYPDSDTEEETPQAGTSAPEIPVEPAKPVEEEAEPEAVPEGSAQKRVRRVLNIVTPEVVAKAIQLFDERNGRQGGVSAIAKELGVHPILLGHELKKTNRVGKRGRNAITIMNITDQLKEQILSIYHAEKPTIGQLAKRLSLRGADVSAVLKENEIVVARGRRKGSTGSHAKRSKAYVTEEIIAIALKAFDDGDTVKDIALQFNVPQPELSAALKANGRIPQRRSKKILVAA